MRGLKMLTFYANFTTMVSASSIMSLCYVNCYASTNNRQNSDYFGWLSCHFPLMWKCSNHVHFTASHVLLIHRQCCVFNSDPLILSHPKTNMALYWLMLSLIFIRQLRHLIEQWDSPCFLLWSPGGEAATRPSRRTQALLCCLIVIKDFFQPQPEYSWDWPWSLYIT